MLFVNCDLPLIGVLNSGRVYYLARNPIPLTVMLDEVASFKAQRFDSSHCTQAIICTAGFDNTMNACHVQLGQALAEWYLTIRRLVTGGLAIGVLTTFLL
jgi:hypothetical protein